MPMSSKKFFLLDIFFIRHLFLKHVRSRMDRRRDGRRGGLININDMYNNDVGQGVVYAYEAYEAK